MGRNDSTKDPNPEREEELRGKFMPMNKQQAYTPTREQPKTSNQPSDWPVFTEEDYQLMD